jgi:hypothetical protein
MIFRTIKIESLTLSYATKIEFIQTRLVATLKVPSIAVVSAEPGYCTSPTKRKRFELVAQQFLLERDPRLMATFKMASDPHFTY